MASQVKKEKMNYEMFIKTIDQSGEF